MMIDTEETVQVRKTVWFFSFFYIFNCHLKNRAIFSKMSFLSFACMSEGRLA